jgi:hypothetical protein
MSLPQALLIFGLSVAVALLLVERAQQREVCRRALDLAERWQAQSARWEQMARDALATVRQQAGPR